MRIAFVWTGLASYMADAWRRLASAPGVELKVWIDVSSASAKAVAFDAEKLMAGVAYEIFTAEALQNGARGVDDVVSWKPDVLFVVGWRSTMCRQVVLEKRLAVVPKICCFDMPWRWKLRCLLAPFVLGRFLRHYDAAFVPGVACARYARWLGFRQVYTGLFSVDTHRFRPPAIRHPQDATYFLYIGRNSSEKRLDDLRTAHRLYREKGGTLALRMCGKGLEGGFVEPEDVPDVMHGAVAFVLASDFDPWPLVLLEAMSAGCPVIASDKCTNRPELGKNWRVFKVGDVQALAKAMRDVEQRTDDTTREDIERAHRYDCREWVKRVAKIVEEVV